MNRQHQLKKMRKKIASVLESFLCSCHKFLAKFIFFFSAKNQQTIDEEMEEEDVILDRVVKKQSIEVVDLSSDEDENVRANNNLHRAFVGGVATKKVCFR